MPTARVTLAAFALAVVACDARDTRVTADARNAAEGGTTVAVALDSNDASADRSGLRISLGPTPVDMGKVRPNFAEHPDGSVSMHTASGAFTMSLRHDSVVVAFSDSIRQHVRSEVQRSMRDSAGERRSALEGMVQGVVKRSVSATLGEVFDKARGFPVSALRDVRYEDGTLRFEFSTEPTWTFENFKTDQTPLLAQFHPADAARFVGAVRARMKDAR